MIIYIFNISENLLVLDWNNSKYQWSKSFFYIFDFFVVYDFFIFDLIKKYRQVKFYPFFSRSEFVFYNVKVVEKPDCRHKQIHTLIYFGEI